MGNYFDNVPECSSNIRKVKFTLNQDSYELLTDNGVFSKHGLDIGTKVFLQTLLQDLEFMTWIEQNEKNVLDLGCGNGVIGIVLQRNFKNLKITAVDINSRAVTIAKENCRSFGYNLEVIQSDGFMAIPERKFDLIVTNPPIRIGKKLLYDLLRKAWHSLTPSGYMYLVVGKKQGAESLQKFLLELAGECEVIGHASGFRVLRIKK